MKSIRHLAPLLLLAGAAQFAYAADDGYSPEYDTCTEKSGGVTSNLLDCIVKETARQDARLNTAYKAAMNLFEDTEKDDLKNAQRLWIQYRDANCNLYTGLTGGTADSINASSCYLEMTKTRAEELDGLAKLGN